ncbi:inhibitor of nuclear factor kappa-B kinase subunit beta [Drosophila obscura]|uniref:inhibitor of nuclear factor kappa-B kinase subunit beta n=1 Tax=Drosophila obscura TaxID=7282 RepID=UPI001BB2B720|nr:inhibitor of nuclear factor kappa-B kinase subunit beta [Drosophila obscura]
MKMDSFRNWQLLGKLGQGGFGNVLHWRNTNTGLEIATKHIKETSSLSADQQVKLKERWVEELKWTREFEKLPNIVAGVCIEKEDAAFVDYLNDHHSCPLPVIILEYCNGGDVRKQLQIPENANGLTEFEVREILGALRQALHFLHTKCKVCHRDLKPDNIVIHRQKDGSKTYKLTDFGLARDSPDKTILQSVVGTRHYFAPEVVESGFYNTAVDYWSLGIIAYELATGELPFIPHQTFKNILVNLLNKKPDCIAITEDLQDDSRFLFQTELPKQNHLTGPWSREFVPWLRQALDTNYKRRGKLASDEVHSGPVPVPAVFFNLDRLLQMRVLTIFAVNDFKRLEYAVTANMTMQELNGLICRDTKLASREVYCVLPTTHPHERMKPTTRPLDLYVQEWSDTSSETRKSTQIPPPPVMLFVFQATTGECYYLNSAPSVSELMKTCMLKSFQTDKPWKLKRLARDMHYMLAEQQKLLEMFLTGIRERALLLEDEIVTNQFIATINDQILTTADAIKMLERLRTAAVQEQKMSTQVNDADWKLLADTYQETNNIARTIKEHFESCLRGARRMVDETSQLFNHCVARDVFGLAAFERNFLDGISLGQFRKAVYEFTTPIQEVERAKANSKEIDKLHLLFIKTKMAETTAKKKFAEIKEQIFQLHFKMLVTAASASASTSAFASRVPPPVLLLSNSMGRLTMNSMGDSSDFDSLTTNNMIDEANRLSEMLRTDMEIDLS